MTKVGCFLGDHTKTGLGTLLNTGTSVGMLLQSAAVGRAAAEVRAVVRQLVERRPRRERRPGRAAEDGGEVMRRRGAALTAAHAALYRTLFEQTAAERRRAMREAEQRRLRRGA